MSITARRAATVSALAVAVGLFLWAYGNRHDFFDLKIYVAALRWWRDGHPLYDYSQPDFVQGRLYFTYPPFAALLLWPFGLLPLDATIAIFTAGSLVALAVTTWWLVAPVAEHFGVPRWYAVGIAVPLVLAVEPTRETLAFGQLNMLLVVLVLVDLLFAVPRQSRWAGAGIGLATAIKLVPGIFIIYLLVTRRWRAAAVAAATAAAATLLAAAVAPRDSWQFWTGALWDTERVGRTDYTANQSLLGLLHRLVAPQAPNRLIWLLLAAAVGAFGLWRAARASDTVAALTLTGLVGSLVSPITWAHHLYWFIPATVVLVTSRRWGLAALTGLVAFVGVVSFSRWTAAPVPTDSVLEFVGRNASVLLALLLLAALPGSATGAARPVPAPRAAATDPDGAAAAAPGRE
jgi:alpha-1,2-mannosyltransferase